MMKRNILAVVIPALLAAGAANAAEIYNKNANKLDLYGKVVGEHTFTTSGDSTTNSDSSYAQIGFKGETQVNDQVTGYGQWEYRAKASKEEGNQDTLTRLAFAGLKFGDAGSFDYGRNYGAIYDVESVTDMFVVWGGDSWSATDNFMTARTTGVATYRNSNFFGLVDGLSFALQYQGKNDRGDNLSNSEYVKGNGDGVSFATTYDFGNGIALSGGYTKSNRTALQKTDGQGDNAEAWATSAKYDANNIYAAVMYAETRNMTSFGFKNEQAGIDTAFFANKTQNFEAVLQYQFDFGLRPSIGYVQSKGKNLLNTDVSADLVKYIEVGSWYYLNKNMNVYAAYQINLLKDNDFAKATGQDTADHVTVGMVYQF